MAPNLDLETYRQIGRNAARYAAVQPTVPVPVRIDNTARLRLIVQTTLLHLRETQQVERSRRPTELRVLLARQTSSVKRQDPSGQSQRAKNDI
jgi:hypothetical protein